MNVMSFFVFCIYRVKIWPRMENWVQKGLFEFMVPKRCDMSSFLIKCYSSRKRKRMGFSVINAISWWVSQNMKAN